jgi:hypothetical protein
MTRRVAAGSTKFQAPTSREIPNIKHQPPRYGESGRLADKLGIQRIVVPITRPHLGKLRASKIVRVKL